MPVLLNSSSNSWIIDSRASLHMSGTRNLFTGLSSLSDIKNVSIANGHHCSVSREGVVDASSQITIEKVFYVPDFPVNLLSISAITCQLLLFSNLFPISLYLLESADGEED